MTISYTVFLFLCCLAGAVTLMTGGALLIAADARHRRARRANHRRVRSGVICRATVTAIARPELGLAEDASTRLLVWACPWAYPDGVPETDVIRAAVRAPRHLGGVLDLQPHLLAVDPLAAIPGLHRDRQPVPTRVMHWRAVLDEYAREHALTHELVQGGAR